MCVPFLNWSVIPMAAALWLLMSMTWYSSRRRRIDDPAEYGAALCRGSFYLQDDEVIPQDDDDLCRFVADRIDTWEVLDLSDLYGAGEDAP